MKCEPFPCELNESGRNALGWSKRWRRLTGKVVGESRNKKCWWVIWDGQKTRNSFSKKFIAVPQRVTGEWQ